MLVEELRADERLAGWLRDLESEGEPDGPRAEAVLPDAIALPDVLLDLSVPHEYVNELVALRGRLVADPEAMTLLRRCVARFVRGMGEIGKGWEPPAFPESTGALGRTFHVFVFVAALPYVRAYHRQRGVPADVSRRTLADLGRHMAVHRRRAGTSGLLAPVVDRAALPRASCTNWGGCSSSARGSAGTRGRRPRAAGLDTRPRRPLSEPAHRRLPRPPVTGGLRPVAGPGPRVLRPPLPGRALRGGGLPLLAARPAAEAVPSGGLQHRAFPGALPSSRTRRRRPTTRARWVSSSATRSCRWRGCRGAPAVERAVGDHLRAGGHWYGGHGWFAVVDRRSVTGSARVNAGHVSG